jgi:type I restriction-modification system DNA methylase subunit
VEADQSRKPVLLQESTDDIDTSWIEARIRDMRKPKKEKEIEISESDLDQLGAWAFDRSTETQEDSTAATVQEAQTRPVNLNSPSDADFDALSAHVFGRKEADDER